MTPDVPWPLGPGPVPDLRQAEILWRTPSAQWPRTLPLAVALGLLEVAVRARALLDVQMPLALLRGPEIWLRLMRPLLADARRRGVPWTPALVTADRLGIWRACEGLPHRRRGEPRVSALPSPARWCRTQRTRLAALDDSAVGAMLASLPGPGLRGGVLRWATLTPGVVEQALDGQPAETLAGLVRRPVLEGAVGVAVVEWLRREARRAERGREGSDVRLDVTRWGARVGERLGEVPAGARQGWEGALTDPSVARGSDERHLLTMLLLRWRGTSASAAEWLAANAARSGTTGAALTQASLPAEVRAAMIERAVGGWDEAPWLGRAVLDDPRAGPVLLAELAQRVGAEWCGAVAAHPRADARVWLALLERPDLPQGVWRQIGRRPAAIRDPRVRARLASGEDWRTTLGLLTTSAGDEWGWHLERLARQNPVAAARVVTEGSLPEGSRVPSRALAVLLAAEFPGSGAMRETLLRRVGRVAPRRGR